MIVDGIKSFGPSTRELIVVDRNSKPLQEAREAYDGRIQGIAKLDNLN